MSRDGFLPPSLTSVHPLFRTPNVAIVVYGVMVAILGVVGTFGWLTRFSNLAALSLYFLCSASTLILRRRNVRADGDPFVIPGGPVVPVLACSAVVWLGFETVRNEDEGLYPVQHGYWLETMRNAVAKEAAAKNGTEH